MALARILKRLTPSFLRPLGRQVFFYLRRPFYFGNSVYCPICEHSFRKYAPCGPGGTRQQCPWCLCRNRHRLLWLFLKNKTDFFRTQLRLLEFAPMLVLAKKYEQMNNIDYLSADIEVGRAMVQMDMTKIDSPDNSFDCIFAFHVLEHIPNDRKAMNELFRVLTQGGWAILQVPIDKSLEKTYEDPAIITPSARKKAFGHINHVRMYGLDYKDRLEAAGFKVTVDNFVESFSAEEVKKYGLDPDEYIYFCRKE